MKNTKKENLDSTNQEEVKEEVKEVDVLAPQPNDTQAVLAYKRLLEDYKVKNPVKYERKREDFIKKIKAQETEGPITMKEVKGHNNKVTRRTFKVPNIQTKKQYVNTIRQTT